MFPLVLNRALLAVVPLLCLSLVPAARAAEASRREEGLAALVDRLIGELDEDQFARRQSATEKLRSMGRAAIPALGEAAASERREVRTRAMEILRRHYEQGEESTRAAAEEVLNRLAEGDDATARLAREVLQAEAAAPPAAVNPFGVQRAAVQIRVANVAANGVNRIQIQRAGGTIKVEVQEGDRRVRLQSDNQGIEVQLTEKKNGKEVTQKWTAKDVEELKKKHPEAHRLYEKYAKVGGPAAPAQRAVPARPPQRPNEAQKRMLDQLGTIQQQLDKQIDELKKSNTNEGDPQYQARLQALEQQRANMERMIQNLRNRR